MATTDTERRVFELSGPPGGGRPERALRISFGPFLARVLAAPEPAPAEELADLASGAEFLHEIMSGGPPLDAPSGSPYELSAYVLSLTDGALDSAHRILGYEDYDPLYGPDPEGRHLALMMRLTDHLDPEGHAFDSILESVMYAEPTEDPQPDPVGGPW
jgi:hypothetical protein